MNIVALAPSSIRSRLADAVPAQWWNRHSEWEVRQPWPTCVVAFHRVWNQTRDDLSVSSRLFRQLCLHWKQNYQVIPLDGLFTAQDRSSAPTTSGVRRLVITFDDGYADNAEIAAPILADLELPATFFVTSHFIGTRLRFPWDVGIEPAPRMMTWQQVRELDQAGFSIGSHTCHHARLSRCNARQRNRELLQSRLFIEQKLGRRVLDFAYPFGGVDDCRPQDLEAVRQAGYRCCLACYGGLVPGGPVPFLVPRICISPSYHRGASSWERHYARARRIVSSEN